MIYLITYTWRRNGQHWSYASTMTAKLPEIWLLSVLKQATDEEYHIINVIEIKKINKYVEELAERVS